MSEQSQEELLNSAKREVTKSITAERGKEEKITSLPLSIQEQKEADEQAALNAAKQAKLDAIVK